MRILLNHICFLCVLLSFCALISAAESPTAETPELSKNVLAAQEKYNEKISKNLKKMQADMDKALATLTSDLTKEYKSLMRKGDLAAVKLLQKRLDVLGTIGAKDVMGNDILTADESRRIFASAGRETKEAVAETVKIEVLYAVARKHNKGKKKTIDVKKTLQSYLDDGHTQFVPNELFGEEMAITSSASVYVVYRIDGKNYNRNFAWLSQAELLPKSKSK